MADAPSSNLNSRPETSPTNTTTKVSGGIGLNSGQVTTSGDMTGRDKTTQIGRDSVGGDKYEMNVSPKAVVMPPWLFLVLVLIALGVVGALFMRGVNSPAGPSPSSTEAKSVASLGSTPAPADTLLPKSDSNSGVTPGPEVFTVTPIVIPGASPAPISLPPAISPSVQTTSAELRPGAIITPENAKDVVLVALLEDEAASRVAWSPNGNLLALVSSGAYLLDSKSLQPVQSVGAQGSALSLAFSPDSRKLAVAGTNGLALWDVSQGRAIRTYAGVKAAVDIDFSADGKTLAVPVDQAVKLLDAESGRELNLLVEHRTTVRLVKFSPTGKVLASVSPADGVKLWDVATGDELRTLDVHGFVNALAFSPDGQQLVIGATWDLQLWDVEKGQLLRPLAATDSTSEVASVALSPDGKILAAARGLTIRLIDVASGRELRMLKGHTTDVKSVAFSPDGRLLASTANDVRLWGISR